MKRKAFVSFTMMTSMLMIAYVVCIAGPPPQQWGIDKWDRDDDTIIVGGITIHANCYLACNTITTGGENRTWRTYHWARAYRPEGGNMQFNWAFTHDPGEFGADFFLNQALGKEKTTLVHQLTRVM